MRARIPLGRLLVCAIGACASPSPPTTGNVATPPAALPAPPPPPPPLPPVAPAASSSAPAASSSAPAATVDAPPRLPASAFTTICNVGHSGGSDIVVAVKDDGARFTIGVATSAAGPFAVVPEGGSDQTPLKRVASGKDLLDGDMKESIRLAGLKVADVAKITFYGVGLRGGWSFGVALVADRAGKVVKTTAWRMKMEVGPPCGS